MSDKDTSKAGSHPLPWLPMAGVAAIWMLGYLNCSVDISSPFPDVSAGEVCAVVPGIGLKWTDLILALISGIIAAGWAESRIGNGKTILGRHIRPQKKSDVKASLWFMTGVGTYFIFATAAGLVLHMSIMLIHNIIGMT